MADVGRRERTMPRRAGSGSSRNASRESGRLLVPRDILRFQEVIHTANIKPDAAVLEDMNGRFLLQHLEHQIVEAKRNTRRDSFEHRGLHAVNAHAHEVRQLGLLAKGGHAAFAFVDYAKIHFGAAGSGRDGDGRLMAPMTSDELIEI